MEKVKIIKVSPAFVTIEAFGRQVEALIVDGEFIEGWRKSFVSLHGHVIKRRALKFNANSLYLGAMFGTQAQGRAGVVGLHEIVAAVCLGPRPVGYDIHHIDEDKHNNLASNLTYVKKPDHSRAHGHDRPARGLYRGVSKNGSSGPPWRARAVDSYGNKVFIGYYDTEEEAAKAFNDFARGSNNNYQDKHLNKSPAGCIL